MADLEELKKRLYKEKETFDERMTPPELARQRGRGSFSWRDSLPQKTSRARLWMFGGAGLLLIALALFFLFGYPSLFETQAVLLKIDGDKEIKSGDTITWQVKITNQNRAALEDAVLIFNFPENSSPINGPKPEGVFRERRSLGRIQPGEGVLEVFNAYVFGGRGGGKEVSAVLEYRPENASATFAADGSFQFSVARSPVSLSFKMPEELRSGQQLDLEINYSSQAETALTGLSLEVALPEGFEYISSAPGPIAKGKFIWRVGDLSPAQSGTLKIKGTIRGTNLEPKIFKAALGMFDEAKNSFLAYDEVSQAVALRSPFLDVSISVNGQSGYTTFPGDTVSVELDLRNNLPSEVKNTSLEVKLEGIAVDTGTLRVEEGSYRETTKSILWNAATHAQFKVLAGSASDKVKFSFKLKNSLPRSSDSGRLVVKISANFKSGSAVQGFEGVDVSGAANYEMKVASKLQLASGAFYVNSTIPNSGPLPPRVGEETTYTVIWSLANMNNDMDGVSVKASLPPYISFKNIISPADANISFDKNSGEIIWNAGRVPAGTGFLRQAVQVAFQIGLVPSPNQIGSSPVIINLAEATGRDTFTDQVLSSRADLITTELPDDPNVAFDQKKVVR